MTRTSKKGESRLGAWFRSLLPDSRSQSKNRETGELVPFVQDDLECPVCLSSASELMRLSICGHFACSSCWRNFACSQIENFAMAHLTCVCCSESLPPSTVIHLLYGVVLHPDLVHEDSGNLSHCKRMLHRYEEFLLRQALAREPDVRWCPRGCGYGLIAHAFQTCPQIVCQHPSCEGHSFCYKCQRPWSNGPLSRKSSDSTPVQHTCSNPDDDIRSDALNGIRAFFGINRFSRQTSGTVTTSDDSNRKFSGNTFPVDPSASSSSKLRRARLSRARNTVDYVRGTRSFMEEFVESDVASPTDDSNLKDERHSINGSDVGLSADSVPRESRRTSSGSQYQACVVKPCPNCKTLIQKLNDGSCNSMVCSVCGYEFCWLCLRETTAGHYLNFSGCTVWGRSRWSKTRRVAAVIGIMLSTPILLPLIVVLAIPTISIGLTVFVARRLQDLLALKNKHVRRSIVLFSVISCLISFPFLSAILLGLCCPVALGYVYAYLPVSLVRSLIRDRNDIQTEPVELVKLQPANPNDVENSSSPPDYETAISVDNSTSKQSLSIIHEAENTIAIVNE